MADNEIINLTADIVSAHVSNNSVQTSDLPSLIRSVFDALNTVTTPVVAEPAKPEPAVSIRASIKPDHLVCLEDGAKLTMLKRYLRTRYNMSPEEYRSKWGLPRDYPMVAPNYAERRRDLAKQIGLGRKPKALVDAVVKPVKKAAAQGKKKLGITAAKAATVAHLGTEQKTPAKKPRAKAEVPAPVEA